MCEPENKDAVEWVRVHYTGDAGDARLVIGNKEQWHSIFRASPFPMRDDIRYVEVPPSRTR